MGEKDNISYLGHWRDSSILVRGQTVLVICVPPLCLQALVLWKTSFPWARYWGGGLFPDDSRALHLLCTLFLLWLHQLHLRSSGIRSQMLGTPDLWGSEDSPSRHTPHVNAAAAKSLQSCPTLSDPIDSSPPGSPVPGILQARILEWVAISFANA